jgi:hypothetical protein
MEQEEYGSSVQASALAKSFFAFSCSNTSPPATNFCFASAAPAWSLS